MEAVKKEFTRNAHGVLIVKCWASCQHCGFDGLREHVRICANGHGEHSNDYLCNDWAIKNKLNDIDLKADGKIKKPHYIMWMREQVSKLSNENLDSKTHAMIVNHLPERYEEILGTRYMDV
jgi:hypothetical protein